jgi:hypothetical protein
MEFCFELLETTLIRHEQNKSAFKATANNKIDCEKISCLEHENIRGRQRYHNSQKFEGLDKKLKAQLIEAQTEKSDERETKEYHLKKLYDLSKPESGELEFRVDGSIWKNGKLIAERPTQEQEFWVERRIHGPTWTWKRWYEQ